MSCRHRDRDGRDAQRQPLATRKAPDGRLPLQNGSFVLPLKAGENDTAVALANNFYGWGLILRLETLDGITLARK